MSLLQEISFGSIYLDPLGLAFDQLAMLCRKKPEERIPIVGVGILVDNVDPIRLKYLGKREIRPQLMEWRSNQDYSPHLALFQDLKHILGIFSRVQRRILDEHRFWWHA